jgi:nitrogen fixation protein NifQ
MQGYTDTIRKYAADNSHAGPLADADGIGEVGLGRGEIGSRLAVRFALKLTGHAVAQARFQVFGCGFTIAACAAAAELVEGRTLEDVRTLTPAAVNRQLAGLPAERSYCAELAIDALQAAVSSIARNARPVHNRHRAEDDHPPRVTTQDPTYRLLMSSPPPPGSSREDRQLFACAIAAARQEHGDTRQLATILGLTEENLAELLATIFPEFRVADLPPQSSSIPPATEFNPEILAILLSHVPTDVTGGRNQAAEWLARILAARAAQPGHLWLAMGLFERPELTAAIRRHLPTLAAANQQGMRWKRYLFKQVCEKNGGVLCKNPNCGDCSDYSLCFAPEAHPSPAQKSSIRSISASLKPK